MRSLPSITNAQFIKPVLTFTFITKVGSVYAFDDTDINQIGTAASRIALGGGLGKSSNYSIEVKIPLADQKLILQDIPRSDTRLNVQANSDTFSPHHGKILSYKQGADQPDFLKLTVTDRVFYDNPKFPVASITDSWATPHPVEIEADTGVPGLYYGDESKRDAYFTAVDCVFKVIRGPDNVSSAWRAEKLFYAEKPTEQSTFDMKILNSDYKWHQQSGSDNLAFDVFSEWRSYALPFDVSSLIPTRALEFANGLLFLSEGRGAKLWKSRNGIDWESITYTDTPQGLDFSGVFWTGSRYAFTFYYTTNDDVYIQQSPDGKALGPAEKALDVGPNAFYAGYGVAAGPSKYMIVATGDLIAVSTEVGSGSWTTNTLSVGITQGVVYAGSKDMFLAWSTINGVGGFTVSTDITNWTVFSQSFPVRAAIEGHGRLVLQDNNTGLHVNTNAGLDFNAVSSMAVTNSHWRPGQLAFGDGKFVATSVQSGNPSQIRIGISSDGWNWDRYTMASTPQQVVTFNTFEMRIQATDYGRFVVMPPTAHPLNGIYALAETGALNVLDYVPANFSALRPSNSRIAITENPQAILDDIFSHYLSIDYRQDQSSVVQVDVSSFKFNAYFSERQEVADIAHEFMQTVGAYAWIGDSGMMNYRSYQESATMTGSIDRTIEAADMIKFEIDDSPIGSPVAASRLTSKYQFKYNYHYQQQRYNGAIALNQANNTMCSSLFAGGLKQEDDFKSKYIMEADVASIWAVNISRTHTLGSKLLEMTLPAKFFDLELADVVKVQNPLLVGSETLAQIVDMRVDYRRGKVNIKAEELKTYVQ